MADTTKIEWTRGDDGTPGATWNPVTGCTKVSSGCDFCYAETLHERFHGKGSFATVTLHPERLDKPMHWRKPRRVFVNSMSDLFHADVPDEYVARVFAVMAMTPRHTYQILTKRHARMRALLKREEFWREVRVSVTRDLDRIPEAVGVVRNPLPNVWLGVSVENQQWADVRVPALLDTPAAVRFLSCEPLLGPVCLDAFHSTDGHGPGVDLPCEVWPRAIDWVIVGGESGPGARPMQPEWARQLRDQCRTAGVPMFFKQWGEHAPRCLLALSDGVETHHCICNGSNASHPIEMRRVGKKAAGRELDGRTWDEYPQAVTA